PGGVRLQGHPRVAFERPDVGPGDRAHRGPVARYTRRAPADCPGPAGALEESRPTPQTLPVTGRSAPVTGAPASLARNRMTSASARGCTQVVKSAFGMSARLAGVSMTEGRTALTVIPTAFNSSARLSVRRC